MRGKSSIEYSKKLDVTGLDGFVSPLHPGNESFEIFLLDGGSTPDSDRRRGITVSTDIVGDVFGFKHRNKFLDLFRCEVQCEANGGARTIGRLLGQKVGPFIF